MKQKPLLLSISLALCLLCQPHQANSRTLLLDSESSALLKNYANPLINAAGLPSQSIKIYLQLDDQINAFASPGRIVLMSGLILATQTPQELQGVIAHEIAHIAGGHIPILVEQRNKAGLVFVTSQILGFGAIFAGLGPLGALILASGTSVGAYSALGETRIAEASADQAAFTYMNQTGLSGNGLLTFFQREFVADERAFSQAYRQSPSPYLRTHPLSSQRLEYLRKRVEEGKHFLKPTNPKQQFAHNMMNAKLYALSKTPQATLEKYPETNTSPPALYARAVMFAYHLSQTKKSLALIDELIQQQPANPFFYELRGYTLTRSNQTQEALSAYQQALQLAPNNSVMRLEVGAILAGSENTTLVKEGLSYLKIAAYDSTLTPFVYRPMARGFGFLGKTGLAELATAEALLLEGKPQQASYRAKKSLRFIPPNDKINRLRANDILAITRANPSQEKRKK